MEEQNDNTFDFSSLGEVTSESVNQEETIDIQRDNKEFDFSSLGTISGSSVNTEPVLKESIEATPEGSEFSYFNDVGANINNIWENISAMPHKADAFVSNYILKAYKGLEKVGINTKGLQAANLADQIGDLAKLDEYHKNLKPTQQIGDAFESGDVKKIAASATGAILNAVSSIGQGLASGGTLPMIDVLTSAYTETLRESGDNDINKQVSLIISDEDKELIPLAEGIISAGLEKVGLDKMTGSILKKIPIGGWKQLYSIASTGGVEGVTEALQSITEQVGRDLSQDREVDIDWEEVRESGYQGIAGGIGISGTSNSVKAAVDALSAGNTEADVEINKHVDEVIESSEAISKELEDSEDTKDDSESSVEIEENISLENTETEAVINEESSLKLEEDNLTEETAEKSTIDNLLREDSTQAEKRVGNDYKEVSSKVRRIGNKYQIKELKSLNAEVLKNGVTHKSVKQLSKLKADINSTKITKLSDDIVRSNKKVVTDVVAAAGSVTAFSSVITKYRKDVGSKITDVIGFSKLALKELNIIEKTSKMVDNFSKIINDNKITKHDLTEVAVYGMLNATKTDPNDTTKIHEYLSEIEANEKKALLSGENGVKSSGMFKKKKYKEENEIIKDVVSRFRKDKNVLSDKQQKLYDYMIQESEKNFEELRVLNKLYFNKNFEKVHNYTRLLAKDFSSKEQISSLSENILDAEFGDTESLNQKSKGHSIERERSIKGTNVVYDLNLANTFSSWAKNINFETETTQEYFDAVSILKNQKVANSLGTDNIKAYEHYLRGYANVVRGRGMDTALRVASKIKSASMQVALGMPGQLTKQAIPAYLQVVATSPIAANKALYYTNLSDEWYRQYAPSLVLRKAETTRFTEESKGHSSKIYFSKLDRASKKASEGLDKLNSSYISIADNFGARLAFLTAFIEGGGDFKNPNPELVRSSLQWQENLQGVSSLAFAGNLFTSKKKANMWLSKTVFSLTNFALNQQIAAWGGARYSLDNKNAAKTSAAAFTSALTYPMIQLGTYAIGNAIFDEIFGDDEDKNEDKRGEELKDYPKQMIVGFWDVGVGGVPIIGNLAEEVIKPERINKNIVGDDYNYSDMMFYDNSKLSDQTGIGGQNVVMRVADGMMDLTEAALADEEGSEVNRAQLELGLSKLARASSIMVFKQGFIDSFMKRIERDKSKALFEAKRNKKKNKK